MCVPACMYACVHTRAVRNQKAWDPLELELRVVSRQGTGTTLGSSRRALNTLLSLLFSLALRDFKIFF